MGFLFFFVLCGKCGEDVLVLKKGFEDGVVVENNVGIFGFELDDFVVIDLNLGVKCGFKICYFFMMVFVGIIGFGFFIGLG